MVICLICKKDFGMITESHMKTFHQITCKEYAKRFGLKKGELNPHHSQNMSGKSNPRFGAVIPTALRNKISKIHKASGRFKGAGNPMFGKTHTPEVRRKLRKCNQGSFGSKNPFFGKRHTNKTKRYISKIRIERGLAKGENNPLYGRGHTKETKEKISNFLKDYFKKHPEKHINSILARNYKKQKNKKGGYISRKQIELYKIIKKKFKDAVLNHPIITEQANYFADIGLPSLKLDLEYDGKYWHKEKSKETVRDCNIRQHGWEVIRINEEEIRTKDKLELEKYVFEIIENFCNSQMLTKEIEKGGFQKFVEVSN